jgi:hypothetical protein
MSRRLSSKEWARKQFRNVDPAPVTKLSDRELYQSNVGYIEGEPSLLAMQRMLDVVRHEVEAMEAGRIIASPARQQELRETRDEIASRIERRKVT